MKYALTFSKRAKGQWIVWHAKKERNQTEKKRTDKQLKANRSVWQKRPTSKWVEGELESIGKMWRP